MSTVVFVSESIPEKGLKRVRKYKVYLSKEEKARILNEVFPGEVPANTDFQINTEVVVKEYNDPERENKNKQYDGIG